MRYIPITNTKARYTLDTNVDDYSWNWNNWTPHNITYISWKLWQCAVFNGSSSYVAIFPISWSKTFVTWVNNQSEPSEWTYQCIYSDATNADNCISSIRYRKNWWVLELVYLCFFGGWNSAAVTLTYTLTLWVWYHVWLTWDWTTMKAYLNWNLMWSATWWNWTDWYWNYSSIGVYKDGNSPNWIRFWNWYIDEVIYENIARTTKAVKDYYNFNTWLYNNPIEM